jgi:hypothetical protein
VDFHPLRAIREIEALIPMTPFFVVCFADISGARASGKRAAATSSRHYSLTIETKL